MHIWVQKMSRNTWNKEFQRINLCMGFSSTKYKIVYKHGRNNVFKSIHMISATRKRKKFDTKFTKNFTFLSLDYS